MSIGSHSNDLFEFVKQGIIYFDCEGKIITANKAAQKITGLPLNNLQGHTPLWKAIREDGTILQYEEFPFITALKTGKAVENFVMGVFNTERDDICWINVKAIPKFLLDRKKPYLVYTVFEDITDQKRKEEALRANEAFLRSIFDGIQDGIAVIDKDLRFLRVNHKIEQWFAHHLPIEGKKCHQVYLGNDQPCESCPAIRTFKEGTPQTEVIPFCDRAGIHHGWLEAYAFPLLDSHFKVTKVVKYMRDITTRKQIEEELKNHKEHLAFLFREQTKKLRVSEERFRCTFENAAIGIGLVAPNGRWIKANAAFCSILGYSEQDLLNLNITDIIHPDDLQRSLELLQQISVGKINSFQKEKRYLHKLGHVIWVHVSVSKVCDTEGRPLYFIIHVQDISKRKQAEHNLRLSEERFSKAFHFSPNLMFITSIEDGIYHEVNDKFVNIMGYSREEVLGKSDLELNAWVNPEKRQEFIRLLTDNKSVKNFEMEFRTKTGEIRYALLSGEIIELNGSKCILGVINDITEIKHYEREMARLDRLNIIGEMAASISHEVRNPMTTVRGFLQMLSMKEECKKHQAYYSLMIEELDRANAIITEFLSVGRNKASEKQMQNLNSIIETLTPLIQADAVNANKKLQVELNNVADLPLDGKEIRQVILNLARNGLEAMKDEGTLTIKTYMENEEVVLEVRDQGCGISPEAQQKLGTPFFTTKEQGTGLGLATCYSIAERHNATVTYQTGPAGTTFFIRFKTEPRLE